MLGRHDIQSTGDAKTYSIRQAEWHNLSEKAINEFCSKLDEFADFEEAFKFLAKARGEIATALEHRNPENYGRIRQENEESSESVWHNRGDWACIYSEVVEKLNALVEAYQQVEDKNQLKYKVTEKKRKHRSEYTIYFNKVPYREILCTDPPNTWIGELSRITMWPKKQGRYHVSLRYPPINKYDTPIDFKIANYYYEQLRSWKADDGVEKFLALAGVLSHFIAHKFYIWRGSASVAEFAVKGLAQKHGIELGPQDNSGMGWAWEALLSPDSERFGNWYASRIFKEARLRPSSIEESDSKKGIGFFDKPVEAHGQGPCQPKASP